MLVLSRKPGEKLILGNGITVTVVEVIGHRVRLGIEAPEDIRIRRAELADRPEITGPNSRNSDADSERRLATPEVAGVTKVRRAFPERFGRRRLPCLPR